MHPDAVAALIRTALPGAEVRVESDDQTHFAALAVSLLGAVGLLAIVNLMRRGAVR